MTRGLLSNVPVWLLSAMVLVGIPAAAVAAQVAVRRRLPTLRSGDHNDVVGVVSAAVGVVYAVVVAFVVVALWEGFSDASAVANVEANKLEAVVENSRGLGPAAHAETRRAALAYAEAVRDDEWPAMAEGRESEAARRARAELHSLLRRVDVATPVQASFLDAGLELLDDLSEARQERLEAASDDVPWVLWAAILLASAMMIGFCLLFGMESVALQSGMVAAVAFLVALNLLLVVLLDHPFVGDVAVEPTGFDRVARALTPPGR